MVTDIIETGFRHYLFEDYLLRNDGILTYKNNEIHIPPKEFEVLLLLVKSKGKILTKEEIFNKVWCNQIASDESLTRCIYTLRRILKDGCKDGCKDGYIETIYGKGYRFKVQVAVISKDEQNKAATTIAIFPFKTQSVIDENYLHHGLIKGMSKYSCLSLNVFPASATQDCKDFISLNELTTHLKPDYYLTGKIIVLGEVSKLYIELVKTDDHRLLEHRCIDCNKNTDLSVFINNIASMLVEKIPNLANKDTETDSVDLFDSSESAISYINGRSELYKFTSDSIHRALSLFRIAADKKSTSAQPYCCIAECYISLAQLGVYKHNLAIENAVEAIDKAIQIDPSNAQALSILGLLTGLKGEKAVADVLFKQASILMPCSADVSYYFAFFHFISGDMKMAMNHVERSLDLEPGKTGALVLKLWLTYYTQTVEQAYNLGKNYIQYLGYKHPVITSMLALFTALLNHRQESIELIQVATLHEDSGYITATNLYTKHILFGKKINSDITTFLKRVDFEKMKGSLLPLIEIAYGHQSMLRHIEELKKEENIWSRIWFMDPRILNIKNGRPHDKAA